MSRCEAGRQFFSFDETVDLGEAFEQVAAAGYKGAELVLGEAGMLRPGTTEKELIWIRHLAENYGLQIISVGSNNVWQHNLASDDVVERTLAADNIKRQILAAHTLGADISLVVPGWVSTPFSCGKVQYDHAYQNTQKELANLTSFAKAAGVSIAIENVWNQFLLSPIEMARYLDEINSEYIGAYFNIGNIIYIGQPEQWIRILNSVLSGYNSATVGPTDVVSICLLISLRAMWTMLK